jgi:hypothetical protein
LGGILHLFLGGKSSIERINHEKLKLFFFFFKELLDEGLK